MRIECTVNEFKKLINEERSKKTPLESIKEVLKDSIIESERNCVGDITLKINGKEICR